MSKVEELEKKIKDLEHKERYSKNLLEKRSLRQLIGKIQRELVTAKKLENKN